MSLDPEQADAPNTSDPEDVVLHVHALASALEGVAEELSVPDPNAVPCFPPEQHTELLGGLERLRAYAKEVEGNAVRGRQP